jgi:trehalose synthase
VKPEVFERFTAATEEARRLLAGRVVWNVNSTARGGGVAEMLRPLLAYSRGAGVDARWEVISGNEDFFQVTKRIHNNLHGFEGDGGPLGDDERRIYEGALEANWRELCQLIESDDVVILHDPQTAGLTQPIKENTGAAVIWRCHVGLDSPSDIARRAWRFLIPYIEKADALVFSRGEFAWEGLDREKIAIIPPSIDAFSPKNQALDEGTVAAILNAAGIVRDEAGADPVFNREDGSPSRVVSGAEAFEERPLGLADPVVLQVSRWDRLKDPLGVIEGFAEHVAPATNAHLVYAGPAVEAVSDDPEGKEVLDESIATWRGLPAEQRERIHLLCLPMDDAEENAAVVNALQRHASVVVQKSIAEGFGLTVAEAMWKARPVVASRIGGIQDQIVHGEAGLLVDDPLNLEEYGAAVRRLLEDRELAEAMGRAAQARVQDAFLGARSLMQYLDLIRKLIVS